MKVNLLAIVGGLLGVMCVLLPWTVTTVDSFFGESTVSDAMTDYLHEDDATFAFAIVLFLLGSALALATPLGGVGQFFGWLMFLAAVYDRLGTTTTSISETTISLGLGFAVGIVAAGMVLFSLARPLGPGYAHSGLKPEDRFLTWSA